MQVRFCFPFWLVSMFPNLTVADVLRAFWSTFVPVQVFQLNACQVQAFQCFAWPFCLVFLLCVFDFFCGVFWVVFFCFVLMFFCYFWLVFCCFLFLVLFFFIAKLQNKFFIVGWRQLWYVQEKEGYLAASEANWKPYVSGWFKYIGTKEAGHFLQDCQNSFVKIAEPGQNWIIVSVNDLISIGECVISQNTR